MNIIIPSFVVIYAPTNDEVMCILERMARIAYQSENLIEEGSANRLIKMLLNQEPTPHESVIEHMGFSIKLICDRGVSHEIVRQRLCSFTQESTRFCSYIKNKFSHQISLVPMLDNLTAAQIERRNQLYNHIEQVYIDEIIEGIKPQQARDNLPTCLKTEIGITCNFREWRHIMRTRTHKTAHPQMRKIMREVLIWARCTYPILFDDVGYLED
jgi:thymidylate synthase (FAD)